MNKENPLSGKEIITIHDLAEQNLIFLEPTISPPEMETLQQQLMLKYPNKVSHFICDTAVTHLMILSNMGVAVMPEFKYKKNEGLVVVPYADFPPISYGVARQKNDTRDFVNLFIKIAQDVFRH
jgi:DNA-binding transcriptional LysR family regulator